MANAAQLMEVLMATNGTAKWVYSFPEGNASMVTLLGGKGANLAEMAGLGLRVPPGFTITTEVNAAYFESGGKLPDDVVEQVRGAMANVEREMASGTASVMRKHFVTKWKHRRSP